MNLDTPERRELLALSASLDRLGAVARPSQQQSDSVYCGLAAACIDSPTLVVRHLAFETKSCAVLRNARCTAAAC
jgi:hypothetical protein